MQALLRTRGYVDVVDVNVRGLKEFLDKPNETSVCSMFSWHDSHLDPLYCHFLYRLEYKEWSERDKYVMKTYAQFLLDHPTESLDCLDDVPLECDVETHYMQMNVDMDEINQLANGDITSHLLVKCSKGLDGIFKSAFQEYALALSQGEELYGVEKSLIIDMARAVQLHQTTSHSNGVRFAMWDPRVALNIAKRMNRQIIPRTSLWTNLT